MKTPLRILFIEDSENDALLAMHQIEKGNYAIEYEIVQTAEKMAESLRAKSWDIILSDYKMPRFNGFEALKLFKRTGLDIPFIIISGTIGEEIAVECMKAGADDYLMKGQLSRLLPAVERELREAKVRAERKRLRAEQEKLERELIQSQKLESLGTLASGIAHDFNNILAIILGYSNLGEQKTLPSQPELMKCFETISKASQRGALLVNQLLTFARKTETLFRSTDINALIQEITGLFSETFPKTIGITKDLQNDIPSVVADATQIHQVFMNLCVNARDAMPSGGTITISTRVAGNAEVASRFPDAGAQRYVAIGISDTGNGMDETTKRKIFDPFFTTKEPGKGTGLGLALVHSILGNHRGAIEVESEPGKGTTFRLYLPVEGTVRENAARPNPVRNHAGGGGETVLLVEDEPFLIEMAQAVLGGKGYSLLVARDGEEGVAMYSLHRNRIGAVLLDFGLPKLRGDEVASRIKTMDPGAKIIMMSGFFDPEIRTNLARIGVSLFLQKPFAFDELLGGLRDVIDA